ncbi:olfactory receptor 1102-like [Protobothrops mucrosquamatus]|uniref:olfactory receptor 1102-like n=1 Tax=Protobothrops mucrosquamatus TaxID=103944 RepID=UPI0010FAFB19|nr:olfactory receptor 1102-like [Protobothrops mucrosquamatus]
MENLNATVTYFILSGFSYNIPGQIFLFLVFSLIYALTLMGNIVIMMVIKNCSHLQNPMYFFLNHLSFLDICYSSVTVPKVLLNFFNGHTISFNKCITQMFFILLTGGTEVFILTAMAYDRYIAIHDPLHYIETMNVLFCKQLVGSTWATGLLYAVANTVPVLQLVFCGPNIIRHFSCEFPSLLALSCTETKASKTVFYVTSGILGMFTFSLTLISYINIFITILKMNSAEARKKTFSTCSSHLIVVALFYVTGYFRYLRPNSVSSVVMDELFSVQYSISTPMLNPIIYSLKTKEVREAIKQLLNIKQISQ